MRLLQKCPNVGCVLGRRNARGQGLDERVRRNLLCEPAQSFASRSIRGVMNAQAVNDWLQIRRQLFEMEASFTTLAIAVTHGTESEEKLQEQRQLLEATRELCSAAYQRAFPPPARSSSDPTSGPKGPKASPGA